MDTPMETTSPAQPEGRLARASSTSKGTRLSCVNCRKRKVKCDRKEPYCANCEKHQELCCYPLERKRVVRRSAYKDMAQRLEKMERLISDFAIEPKSIDDTPSVSEESQSGDSPKDKPPRKSPTVVLPSIEESDYGWGTQLPPLENGREPFRQDRYIPHLLTDGEDNGYNGSCSIFSPPGIEFVNRLVGDDSFAQMLSTLKPVKKARQFDFETSLRHPLPSNDILVRCVQDFLATLNTDIILFQEEVILDGVQAHLNGTPRSGVAWYASINIIVALATRSNPELECLVGDGDWDKYLYNTMSVIPSLLLQQANELSIGALLATTMFFMFSFENETAVTLLGSTIQQMTIGGFQYNRKPSGVTDIQMLHRRRLFWHGFCLDNDLSLRLGKPPVVNSGQIIDLPDEHPTDGRGVITFNGESFNFLREHVALSKLQNKTYTLLYSDKARAQNSTEQLHACIDELDEGLRHWKENVPEILRPQNPLDRSDYSRLICVTVLHYTYFQLTIAVHSALFGGYSGKCPTDDPDDRIIPSVALCVGAARASISLLNYHDNTHPFTVFLINHVAWSVDILFMNILHNKTSPRVYEDLELLEKIVKFYEKYDANRANTPAYQITKALYRIASRAVKIAQGQPQGQAQVNIRQIPVTPRFQNGNGNGVSFPAGPGPSASSGVSAPLQQRQIPLPSMMDNMAWSNNGVDHMTFLDPEWMMPMGFQPEYWQDPWANVFQDHDMSDLSLQSANLPNQQVL